MKIILCAILCLLIPNIFSWSQENQQTQEPLIQWMQRLEKELKETKAELIRLKQEKQSQIQVYSLTLDGPNSANSVVISSANGKNSDIEYIEFTFPNTKKINIPRKSTVIAITGASVRDENVSCETPNGQKSALRLFTVLKAEGISLPFAGPHYCHTPLPDIWHAYSFASIFDSVIPGDYTLCVKGSIHAGAQKPNPYQWRFATGSSSVTLIVIPLE